MFSLDLDVALGEGRRGIDAISVYLGNPSAGVSSGICYNLDRAGLRLDNLYYFFDRKHAWDTFAAKVAASLHLDLDRIDLQAILWPELRDCQLVVAANKKTCDGVYFSRIGIDQLIGFMGRTAWPPAMLAFVEANRGRLDHLLYDVGIDYRMVEGRIEILKSAYYGVL